MIINKLGAFLKQRQITEEALAARGRWHRQWVHELVKPHKSLTTKTRNRLCEILHCQPYDLEEYIPDALYRPPKEDTP